MGPHGYSASGVAEVTAAAGVPNGSFHDHFDSKEGFASAALDNYWNEGRDALELPTGSGSADERVRAHFKAIDRLVAPYAYAAGCMLGNFAIETGPISDPMRKHVECMADGQRDGTIDAALPPETLALFLIAAWHGAVQRAKVERNGKATAALHRTFAALLTR